MTRCILNFKVALVGAICGSNHLIELLFQSAVQGLDGANTGKSKLHLYLGTKMTNNARKSTSLPPIFLEANRNVIGTTKWELRIYGQGGVGLS